MSLSEYKAKRDFDKTCEPKGKVKKENAQRFVVQYHEARTNHYDFRLEFDGVLKSWAVPKGFSTNPKDKRLAVMVEDHPVDYIGFEGIIPKGNYGAGTVEIFDKGNYLPIKDFEAGLKKGHLKFLLNGEKLKGAWSLLRVDGDNWLLVKIDDKYAAAVIKPASKNLPVKNVKCMLATLSSCIPSGEEWVYEIKYDGYRIISYVQASKVKMVTRNGQNYTNKFKEIADSLAKIKKASFVVDGEVVVFDEVGRSDFGSLQKAIKTKSGGFVYVIFDLLCLEGEDLRELPLLERKKKLERLLFKGEKNLLYSSHVSDGEAAFKFAKENGLEGIVAKKASSIYEGVRSENWLKIKCYRRQEFVVIGYSVSDKNEAMSALHLGYYDNKGNLIYAGKVGTGFSDEERRELRREAEKYIVPNCPAKGVKNSLAVWLKPMLVAEISYAEVTKSGVLRQPSFVALRKDKNPKDVKLEEKLHE